jgi:hypothetical protein
VDPLPLVFDAKTARAYGYSRGEINHLLRSTRWSAVRRGLYCETVRLNAMGDVGRHAAQVLAALQVAGPNAAASRWSAAVLHGLPAPRQVPNHVSLVAPTGVRRQRNGMSVAVAALPPSHIDGQMLRLTSIARTVVDVARHASFIDAVMVADAALYRRLVSKEALYEMVAFQRQWPGVTQARNVVVFADARAESLLSPDHGFACMRSGFHSQNFRSRFLIRQEGSSGGPTFVGLAAAPLEKWTERSNTPAAIQRSSSTRSCGRMPSGTKAGSSSAGRAPTSKARSGPWRGDFALRSREAAAVIADGTPRARLRSPLHQILSEMPVFPMHSGRGVMLQGTKSCSQSAKSGRRARREGP